MSDTLDIKVAKEIECARGAQPLRVVIERVGNEVQIWMGHGMALLTPAGLQQLHALLGAYLAAVGAAASAPDAWRCRNCDSMIIGTPAPAECPDCGAPRTK